MSAPARSWRAVAVLATVLASCRAPAPDRAPRPAFVLQNSPWVNLHHFLRAEARRAARGAAPELALERLDARERAAWGAALAAYRGLAPRDLLHDEGMVVLNVALAGVGAAAALPAGLLEPALQAHLAAAAPVYRRHAWPAHARANAAWIADLAPLVAAHGAELTAALAQAYRCAWPAEPILVDPSHERGPVLAYTTRVAPPGFAGHVTIDPGAANRGAMGFECLAHEASHVVDEVLVGWIEAESARQGRTPPPELWHALLFFTSGLVAERVLGRAGTYARDVEEGYSAYHEALERHWRPYLEGRVPFERALSELVRAAGPAADAGR